MKRASALKIHVDEPKLLNMTFERETNFTIVINGPQGIEDHLEIVTLTTSHRHVDTKRFSRCIFPSTIL